MEASWSPILRRWLGWRRMQGPTELPSCSGRPPACAGGGATCYLERKKTRLNLEVSLAEEMVELALSLKLDSVCLVPENRMESDH